MQYEFTFGDGSEHFSVITENAHGLRLSGDTSHIRINQSYSNTSSSFDIFFTQKDPTGHYDPNPKPPVEHKDVTHDNRSNNQQKNSESFTESMMRIFTSEVLRFVASLI